MEKLTDEQLERLPERARELWDVQTAYRIIGLGQTKWMIEMDYLIIELAHALEKVAAAELMVAALTPVSTWDRVDQALAAWKAVRNE